MEQVILWYDGHCDYLFEIEHIEDLQTAIEYKNEQRDSKEYEGYSDFEIILDFLDKNKIKYSYTDLMNTPKLEY